VDLFDRLHHIAKNMRFILLLIASATQVVSCKQESNSNHNQIETLSDEFPLPNDSLAFYFPQSSAHSPLDSFKQNWYSSALYSLKE
jgi:hypothetical protein